MSVVVGVFEREAEARHVVEAVRALGVDNHQVGVRAPGYDDDPNGLIARAAYSLNDPNDLAQILVALGVPEGEARFYAIEAGAGRTLVVVEANAQSESVRDLLLDRGGYDVQSRGAALIRAGESNVPSGTSGRRPVDLTTTWTDFRSRYQMLWQQHYGTTDQTWEQMEPIYRDAWQLANRPEYRGRPWSEVLPLVRRDWQSSPHASAGLDWSQLEGPIRDVWDDVAEEAVTGAEGGADRRIPSQGTDQTVAARDLEVPPRGAA